MAELYLICKGEHGSLDLRVLDLVLGQIMELPIRIEPAGGGSQPRSCPAMAGEAVAASRCCFLGEGSRFRGSRFRGSGCLGSELAGPGVQRADVAPA